MTQHGGELAVHDDRFRLDQLLSSGRADEAVVLARRLTWQWPADPWTWHRLAAALLVSDGDIEAAQEARTAAEQAVTLDPTSAMGYRMLSEASLRLGDPDSALATMRAAVQAAPDSWVAHLDLAAALADRPGGAREAYRIAQRATRLAAHRPEPHLMVGDLALRDDDMATAEAAYLAALSVAPDSELARGKLAQLHERQRTPTGVDRSATRAAGNGLATLGLLAVVAGGVLAALAPTPAATWYRVVVLVAGVGLILLAAAGAAVLRGLPTEPGYRVGLVAAATCVAGAVLAMLIGGIANSAAPVRVAVFLGVAGYGVGHLTARCADRAGTPTLDERPADRMRAAALLNLALGSLLHGVALAALALLFTALPHAVAAPLGVVAAIALLFVAGLAYATIIGDADAHRQRFGWRPVAVLVGVGAAGFTDVLGSAGLLSLLFAPTATLLLLVAAFVALAVAAVAALSATTLR